MNARSTDPELLLPLAFDEPERLVRLWEHPPGYDRMEVSPPNYRDWRSMATSFEAMAAYDQRSANLLGESEPIRVQGSGATAELLPMLGVRPELGRAFTEEDHRSGAPRTVVLTMRTWLPWPRYAPVAERTAFFTVSHRAPDIGVRIALGARPLRILGLILRGSFSGRPASRSAHFSATGQVNPYKRYSPPFDLPTRARSP